MLWMANRYGERSLAIAARYHLDGGGVPGEPIDVLMHWCQHGVLHDGQCNFGAGMGRRALREEMEREFPQAVAFRDPSADAAYGRKTHVGYFRSSFTADNASWAAFKGGQNHFDDHGSDSHNNHGHLDLGHFVFEMGGQRWAVSIGSGQYDYPDLSYFGRFRFGCVAAHGPIASSSLGSLIP